MGSLIANSWALATIRIKNDWEECGTGLLVSQTYEELAPEVNEGAEVDKRTRTFLVTNKHVLGKSEEQRQTATKITMYPHVSFPDGKVRAPQEWPLQLIRGDGSKIWRGHPYPWIDILAFDITYVVEELAKESLSLGHAVIPYSLVADKEALLRYDVTIGDEVLIVGFPDLIPHVSYWLGQFAFVQQGVIASRIGEDLMLQGSTEHHLLPGFLVDVTMVKGSSGSPVILKPVAGRVVRNKIVMTPNEPILLGMITNTIFAEVEQPITYNNDQAFSGFGLAINAAAIRHTILAFQLQDGDVYMPNF